MTANSALAIWCCSLSLLLIEPDRSQWSHRASRILSLFTAALATAVVLEYAVPAWHGIDSLLASAHTGASDRMSITTALSIGLLSLITLLLRTPRPRAAAMADVACWLLCGMVLVTTYQYIFGAIRLSGRSSEPVTSPQTLVCLILLTFAAFGPRTGQGIFGILMSAGLGGRIARMASPFTFFVPFIVELARNSAEQEHLAGSAYLTALAAAVSSMLAFGLLLILAQRIDRLEAEVRELSLRDELTQVYNRRGFQIAATQSLLLARRAKAPFSVLYIDLDNLKSVNDSFGHETGSQFIREVAHLLKSSFRAADVVGRIGGDEFVVAGVASAAGIAVAADHLAVAVAQRNQESKLPYRLSFSFGHVTSTPDRSESLDDLLTRADAEMYQTKRLRKQSERQSGQRRSTVVEQPR